MFIDIGGTNIVTAATSGGTGSHIFHMRAYITQATSTQQRTWYTFENNVAAPRMGDFLLTAFDPTTAASITASVQLVNSADNVQINGIVVRMGT